MEGVSARTFQVGALAYALGGGFSLMKAAEDWVLLRRHPNEQYALTGDAAPAAGAAPRGVAAAALRFAGHEAWRSARVAMAGIFTVHAVALARYGRNDARAQNAVEVPEAVASGAGVAALVYLDYHAPVTRALQAGKVAAAAGALAAARQWYLRARGGGGSSSRPADE
jgi:hypothetical protein